MLKPGLEVVKIIVIGEVPSREQQQAAANVQKLS